MACGVIVLVRMLERFWHGCGNCRNGEGCALVDQLASVSSDTAPPRSPFALTAALVFLLPLALAIGAAALIGRWASYPPPLDGLLQFAGLAGGFVAGVLLARGLLRGIRSWRGRAIRSE